MDVSFIFLFAHFWFDENNFEIDEAKQFFARAFGVPTISKYVIVSNETCISCKESIQIGDSIELYRTK